MENNKLNIGQSSEVITTDYIFNFIIFIYFEIMYDFCTKQYVHNIWAISRKAPKYLLLNKV